MTLQKGPSTYAATPTYRERIPRKLHPTGADAPTQRCLSARRHPGVRCPCAQARSLFTPPHYLYVWWEGGVPPHAARTYLTGSGRYDPL